MDELQLQFRQQTGLISIENFDEIRDALAEKLSRYQNVVYTNEMLDEAKKDKKCLRDLHKEIDERRKLVKKTYLEPYNRFEKQVKELLSMIDAPLGEIQSFLNGIEEQEKLEKRKAIKNYFQKRSAPLNGMAQQVWDSPVFFENKWLNKTTSAKTWQAEVDAKISSAAKSIQNIQATGGQHTGALIAKYLETLSIDGLSEYRARLAAAGDGEIFTLGQFPSTDQRTGYKILKLTGNVEQMIQAMELLAMLGIETDEIEDGMPQPMPELLQPDFDSFVAFDLETSGTYGAASGDVPAEITEIGAVKVENGQITERFSQLVNPGRKILPRISKITGITDAMVAGEPDISTVIRQFADFIGNRILVGHNIKASDLHYIDQAASKAGIRIENPFFDTYCFARSMKDAQGWENVKLEYLSKQFGVEQPEAHRACCDAQANARIYFKLKELA